VLQCVAVCCSVSTSFLFPGAVCCSVLQCVAVCCRVLQCVAVCCSVLQCVAVCCSVLQCVCVHTYRKETNKIDIGKETYRLRLENEIGGVFHVYIYVYTCEYIYMYAGLYCSSYGMCIHMFRYCRETVVRLWICRQVYRYTYPQIHHCFYTGIHICGYVYRDNSFSVLQRKSCEAVDMYTGVTEKER